VRIAAYVACRSEFRRTKPLLPRSLGRGLGRVIVPSALVTLDRYHRAPIERLFGPKPPRAGIDPSLNFLFVCFTVSGRFLQGA
jgi:hypothetical protein